MPLGVDPDPHAPVAPLTATDALHLAGPALGGVGLMAPPAAVGAVNAIGATNAAAAATLTAIAHGGKVGVPPPISLPQLAVVGRAERVNFLVDLAVAVAPVVSIIGGWFGLRSMAPKPPPARAINMDEEDLALFGTGWTLDQELEHTELSAQGVRGKVLSGNGMGGVGATFSMISATGFNYGSNALSNYTGLAGFSGVGPSMAGTVGVTGPRGWSGISHYSGRFVEFVESGVGPGGVNAGPSGEMGAADPGPQAG